METAFLSKPHGVHSNFSIAVNMFQRYVGQAFPLLLTLMPCRRVIFLQEEQQALMKFLESMPREVPEVARSMPHWRQRAAAG